MILKLTSATRVVFLAPFVLISLLLCGGCRSSRLFTPPQVLPDDRHNVPAPENRSLKEIYSTFDYPLEEQSASIFDISFHIRSVLGRPKQSMNVNAFGEVADSSWFTNRNGLSSLSPEAVCQGPGPGFCPDIHGPLIIVRARDVGMSPEFTIRDRLGGRYILKFDPLGYNELCSGAEVIVSRILHAAGYNVPENSVIHIDPDYLIRDQNEGSMLEDERGRLCRMTEIDLKRLKDKIHVLLDGKARVLAVKALPGKPLGPFLFAGTRMDDHNDIVPHEHRRELRGLFPLCAWLKHFDIKNSNSQDQYIEENGCFYVKHYLVNFRTTLGADISGPMPSYLGHEMIFDFPALASNLMYLGLKVQSWESSGQVRFPSVGRFDDDSYLPGKSRTNYYFPAFMNITNLDGYWGAKLVMSFSDEQLAAVIDQAGYSNDEAASYLLKTLISRRDLTGRHWFSRTNPLDRFHFQKDRGNWSIRFVDLGIFYKLWSGKKTQYRYNVSIDGKKVIKHSFLRDDTALSLTHLEQAIRKKRPRKPIPNRAQREITLWLSRNLGQTWSKSIKIYYILNSSTGNPVLLGIVREE